MYNVVRCVSSGTPRRLCRLMPSPETRQHRRSEPQAMRPKVAEPLKLHQTGIWRQLGEKRKYLCADKLRQIGHSLVRLYGSACFGQYGLRVARLCPCEKLHRQQSRGERRRNRAGARHGVPPASRKVPVGVPASAGLKLHGAKCKRL